MTVLDATEPAASPAQDRTLLDQVSAFIYREARLADSHQYEAWEALWADDGVYWVPSDGDGGDPETEMSIIYDNRSRISLRVRQLLTGRHFTQSPRSPLCRVVSNIEVLDDDGTTVHATSNALVFEAHLRGDTLWGARTEYRLRREGGSFRMVLKKVVLANNDRPLFSMAFIM